jgi:choline dehydrogenase
VFLPTGWGSTFLDPKNKDGEAMQAQYEYIVVGSGAGGGPLAANLAEAGYKVLLLEAGGSPQSYDYQVPAFHTLASENPEMSWAFFVRHYADDAQQQRDSKFVKKWNGRDRNGVFYPRAGTLGGCTAHHAMLIVYPHDSDWDHIAEITGDESWRANHMRRYFQRLERCEYRKVQKFLQWILRYNPSHHGFKGWLSINKADPRLVLRDKDKPLLEIIKDSALTSLGSSPNPWERLKRSLKTLFDPNDWRLVKKRRVGVRFAPLSTEQGRRVGSRERILAAKKAFPENLDIKMGALATRVLFDDDKRAIGVEYLDGEHLYGADPHYQPDNSGTPHQVHASREVILAGGAFNTPQLLQLSGIGPAELLRQHGIEVIADRPGVGANLQDRYEVTVVNRMKEPFTMLEGARIRPPRPGDEPEDPHFQEWLRGEGIYTTNGAVLSIIRKSKPVDKREPDIFLFALVTNFRGYYPGYHKDVEKAHSYLTWAILKGHTNNTDGRVAICSKDPRDVPCINFHYFQEGNDTSGEDLEAVVDAVELVRDMTAQYHHRIAQQELPGKDGDTGKDINNRDEIRQFVKDEAWGHHASCTCKIGAPDDKMAVLDSQFRVYGTQNLRVVDASVFPRIPGLFIVSAVYMIAEKASDIILADATG